MKIIDILLSIFPLGTLAWFIRKGPNGIIDVA